MSTYPISSNQNAAAAIGSNSTNSTTGSATDYQQTFMKLLATELQSQDPTQTMDPTTMVTQMVQINQLSDVAGIYSILQGRGTTSGATSDSISSSGQSTQNTVGGH